MLWFRDHRTGFIDCGFNSAHRNYLEIVGREGLIRVPDFADGDGKAGIKESHGPGGHSELFF